MKCPKCGYLGFEQPERCRNCGYEFVLSSPRHESDLTLRDAREVRLIGELDLKPSSPAAALDAGMTARSNEHVELPLFTDDVPLITTPSRPRAPLAVRRATPEIPRVRADGPRTAPLSFHEPELRSESSPTHLDSPLERPQAVLAGGVIARPDARAAQGRDVAAAVTASAAVGVPARLVARLTAVAIDLMLLAVVDLAVLYLTLQTCGLTTAEWHLLPPGPLLAFLIVQNGGYLVAFTAGGQTIGKMAAGIRVVAAEPDQVLDLGRALQRTVLWAVLALPAGLGLLSALLNADRRGLHDRVAGTKVVRAVA